MPSRKKFISYLVTELKGDNCTLQIISLNEAAIKRNEKHKGKTFQTMMTKYLRITSVVTAAILLLSLNFSCSGKEAVEDTLQSIDERPEPDGKDTESWV